MVPAFQLGLTLTVALGSTTYGYCSSIIATTLGQPSFIHYFHLDTDSDANSLIGAVNGLFQAGGLFGSLSSLYIPDKWGRKAALYIGAIICVVGGTLQTGSVHIAMFLVARLITRSIFLKRHFATKLFSHPGALVGLVPLYQSEVSPTHLRGFLVGLHGVMICIGYTSASWIGVGFYFVQGNLSQWRGPLGFQILFPLVLLCALPFVPESPRWRKLTSVDTIALHG
ncbi:hypothetical protein LTR46_011248 [Exophiala xenobiotica]|nr:hypothetical protein LTR46_011248 [Exophiala xenobiotica]